MDKQGCPEPQIFGVRRPVTGEDYKIFKDNGGYFEADGCKNLFIILILNLFYKQIQLDLEILNWQNQIDIRF